MTAVEFYNSKVIELMKQREQGTIDVLNFRNELDQVFEQAKEMDRHRIINAVTFGQNNHTLSISDDLAIAEQYYNQTFKSE